ncbi:MAG: anaerobic glycerol-3-phosphate dehydrogenase subunit C [Planctomyces sp.]|nr:anaerobic glycerol-3-phosphate dehydrogenase subunit C [Planctomyces sp.]
MDDQQQRVAEDLAGTFAGELLFDALTCLQYATDGSLYQVRPLGVACPRSREDVIQLARYAHENRIPLIARGAGTGLAGGCLGRGLVIDFSRHMREIESVDGNTVRVQPGVVRDVLNRRLREFERYFPPDPSSSAVTTIGGMLGVDAAGSHAIRVGSTRDHVLSLEVVLAEGSCIEAGLEPIVPPAPQARTGDEIESPSEYRRRDPKQALIEPLARLLRDHQGLIREYQPPLIRNVAGYHLRTVLGRDEINLPRLLTGSEGTLGLFTAATLHTSPLPAHRGVALLLFGQLEPAVRSVPVIAEQQPSACDLLDRRLLSLARETTEKFELLIPKSAEAALLVEQTGFTRQQVQDRLRMAISAARSIDPTSVVAAQAFDFDDVEFLWSLPYRVVPLLTRLKGATRPLPIVEDISIPPGSLNEFLVEAQRVFQRHQVTASLYAHAASGQIHLRPFLAPPTPATGPFLETLARDLYDVALDHGGSVSGEHGDGLARTAFLRQQYGPLYQVFTRIKQLFDPRNILNPGKIINDDPHLTIRNFRPHPLPEEAAPQLVDLQWNWSREELSQSALSCNGCGGCRSIDDGLRMCPFFRRLGSEEAAPRSKANVLRGLIDGELSPRELASDGVKRLADLCFNCKQCQLECPANVDIPHLILEARAAYVAANGLSRADWILSRAHSFGKLGARFAPFANWALQNRPVRWLLDRFLGIARERKLPRFSRRTFLRQCRRTLSDRRLLSGDPRPVVYFVDHFVNYHDPELGWALTRVLAHHGIPVFVPQQQIGSGMAMVSAGDLDAAREVAERNIRVLAEHAREGFTILCTEPAAALCLTQEYPRLLDHPDVPVVAAQVVEAGALFEQLASSGRLKNDFQPLGNMTVGYHTPCHLRALHREPGLVSVLRRVPGLHVTPIEEGCSGMAGAFGLTREHYEMSIDIGRDLIDRMRQPDLMLGATECSSCRIQMEQGTATPTLHPLKLLALAYGLMPEIRERLRPGTGTLVTT